MCTRRCAFGLVCVLALFLLQGPLFTAHADSFTYQFSTTVFQYQVDNNLGTVEGTFTIDTSPPPPGPCPSQGCFNTENPPTITGSLYWYATGGPVIPLTISIDLVTGGYVDAVPEVCSLDAGTFCGMLIVADGIDSSGYSAGGGLDFVGDLGQTLNVLGYDDSLWNASTPDASYGEAVVEPTTATVVTPEPSTRALFLLGLIPLSLFGLKRLSEQV